MIEFAFNSELLLKKFIKNNYDGSKQYSEPQVVSCYKEEKETKILSAKGEEVTSKTNYYTIKPITVDDIVDGEQILNVEKFSMLGVVYYRSYI